MPAADRLLKRMQRTKHGWGWEDLDRLYRGFGFRVREGGSHTVYWHPDYPELQASVARHGDLPPGYVQTALKRIERLKELEAEAEQEEEDNGEE